MYFMGLPSKDEETQFQPSPAENYAAVEAEILESVTKLANRPDARILDDY
jgi:hypothetical protein